MKMIPRMLCFIMLTTSLQAQNVDDIVIRYLEAIGGLDKWKSIRSTRMSGKVTTPERELEITVYRKYPQSYRMEIDFNGTSIIPQAYDGDVGWTYNPFHGASSARKLASEPTKRLAMKAIFENPLIDHAQKGHLLQLVGTQDVEGAPCYKLKLIKNQPGKSQYIEYHYFDKENFMRIKTEVMPAPGSGTSTKTITLYSDFQTLEAGVVVPFYVETLTSGLSSAGHGHGSTSTNKQKLLVQSFEINPELQDSIFNFPNP